MSKETNVKMMERHATEADAIAAAKAHSKTYAGDWGVIESPCDIWPDKRFVVERDATYVQPGERECGTYRNGKKVND